jgi:hypothetical protein
VNVDTDVFAAITGRAGAIEAELIELRARVNAATRAEELLRRAAGGIPLARPATGRHARDRHGLRLVAGGKS